MKNIVAFFDIDGTIFRNSLMLEHFKKLMSFEVIDPAIWYSHIKQLYLDWESRFGDFEQYLEATAEVYVDELKGIDKAYIEFIADHVIKANGDMVYKYSRDQIAWHKDQSHKIFFISGSPDFLVSKMAEKYEVDEYRGTLYFVDEDNKFTGQIKKMWTSANKKVVLKELIEKYQVDLDNSYAYGDTAGDLSMLRLVGNPVAINPNKELLTTIKEEEELAKKTKIVVERKDVIYELDASVPLIS